MAHAYFTNSTRGNPLTYTYIHIYIHYTTLHMFLYTYAYLEKEDAYLAN